MVTIDIAGAGIVGLWQAAALSRRGHSVTVFDPAGVPSAAGASRYAGAMLAPYCEGEAGHEHVRDLGVMSLALWTRFYPETRVHGTLVLALARDKSELERFAHVTLRHRTVTAETIAELEPDLAGRFGGGLFYDAEGHVSPQRAMAALAIQAKANGAAFETAALCAKASRADFLVDTRGFSAREALRELRGVRGERFVIDCPDVSLKRPVRLLHPRIPFYIVPWGGGRFMVGATVIESEDEGPPSVRSGLELLGALYALHPSFGEARIVEFAAGVRPAFPSNIPRITVREREISVNGAYRHGFLLAPILAELTADYIETGARAEGAIFEDYCER